MAAYSRGLCAASPNGLDLAMSESGQPFRLDGKIALITGGASGIGAETAKELTRGGGSVIIADLNVPAATALAAELPGARALHMDVTSVDSIQAAASTIS